MQDEPFVLEMFHYIELEESFWRYGFLGFVYVKFSFSENKR
jgi:hypothetical protein